MKLFHYVTNCSSSLQKQEAIARVQSALTSDRAMRITPIRATENELFFSVKNTYFLEKNSFIPDVRIQFCDTETGSGVETVCSLKRIARIFFTVMTALLAALEILLLCWYFSRKLDDSVVLLIPVIMIVFSCLITFFGLRLSSRDVLYVIRAALKPDAVSE